MASKLIVVLCACFAAANAGYLGAPVATYAAAPAPYAYTAAAPAPYAYAAAAPVVRYSPADVVSHSYSSFGAPAALTYAAPVAKTYYAPGTVAVSSPAIGSTQQNIVRSFDGTVSQYSKAVDTAFSSVRKYDTRINNNVYTPAIAKTLTYASAPAVVAHAAPAYVTHAAPAVVAHSAPGLVAAAPATAYATKAISYSPAGAVAHVTFDGLGVHYGW